MQHEIDLEAWKREGRRFWARIQKEKLVVLWWKNPGIRIAIVAAVFLTLAVVIWFSWKRTYLPIASLIVAVPFCYVAIRLLLIGIRTRGLYSFFTEDGFGVGCDADRIKIPYDQIELPEVISPFTVEENYIVLPLKKDPSDIVIESKKGEDQEWDGSPYTRGTVTLARRGDELVVEAYPGQLLIELCSAIYPLAVFLSERQGASNTESE